MDQLEKDSSRVLVSVIGCESIKIRTPALITWFIGPLMWLIWESSSCDLLTSQVTEVASLSSNIPH